MDQIWFARYYPNDNCELSTILSQWDKMRTKYDQTERHYPLNFATVGLICERDDVNVQ